MRKIPVLSGKRAKMEAAALSNAGARAFRFSTKPSSLALAFILNHSKAKKLVFSKAIYSRMAKKVIRAMKNIGVKVEVVSRSAGRPRSLQNSGYRRARKLVFGGKPAAKACKKAGISRRTYYYYKALEENR